MWGRGQEGLGGKRKGLRKEEYLEREERKKKDKVLVGRGEGEEPREVRERRMEWRKVRIKKVRGGGIRSEERRRTEGQRGGRDNWSLDRRRESGGGGGERKESR